MILNITSYPRSGNSFFAVNLLAFSPLWRLEDGRTATFRPVGSLYSSTEILPPDIQKVPYYNRSVEDRNPIPYIQDKDSIYVYKRHDNPGDYAGPRIYIIRNGLDVIVSYAHHKLVHGKVRDNLAAGKDANHGGVMDYSQDDLYKEMEYFAKYSDWGRYVMEGLEHPSTGAVVRYEHMIADPAGTTRRALLDSIAVRVDQIREIRKFDDLHKIAPWFYRRGEVGSHESELPKKLRDLFLSSPSNRRAMEYTGYL